MVKVKFNPENELILLPMDQSYTNGVKTANRVRIRRIRSFASQPLPTLKEKKKLKLKVKTIIRRLSMTNKQQQFVQHPCSKVNNKECFHCQVETALYGSPEKKPQLKEKHFWQRVKLMM